MEITATAKYIHVTPRKLRLLARSLKGMTAKEAIDGLRFLKKSGSLPFKKVIESAIANAQRLENKKTEELKIKEIEVTEGPKWQKWDKSHRIFHESRIIKRAAHIKVVLE